MFDIGWAELLVIATVLIVVVGPKDLPAMLRTFGKTVSKLRGMAAEFRGQFDDALREAELDEVRKAVDDVRGLSPRSAISKASQPFRQAGEDVRRALDEATAEADDDEPFDSAVEFDAPHEMEPFDPPDLTPEVPPEPAVDKASKAQRPAGPDAGHTSPAKSAKAKAGAAKRESKPRAAAKPGAAKAPASAAKPTANRAPGKASAKNGATRAAPKKRPAKPAKTDEAAT